MSGNFYISVILWCWYLLLVFFHYIWDLSDSWYAVWFGVETWIFLYNVLRLGLKHGYICMMFWDLDLIKLHILCDCLWQCTGRGWGGVILLFPGGTRNPGALLGLQLTIKWELLLFLGEGVEVPTAHMVSTKHSGRDGVITAGWWWKFWLSTRPPLRRQCALLLGMEHGLHWCHGSSHYWLTGLQFLALCLAFVGTNLAEVLGTWFLPQESGNLGSPLSLCWHVWGWNHSFSCGAWLE